MFYSTIEEENKENNRTNKESSNRAKKKKGILNFSTLLRGDNSNMKFNFLFLAKSLKVAMSCNR